MAFKMGKLPPVSMLLWLGMILSGFGVIWRHENSPGLPATPPTNWPLESGIERKPGLPTLIVIAHPKCPCTRASIGELALLMAHSQNRVRTYVLFYKPSKLGSDWPRTDVWESASAIPGVMVKEDNDGVEARRFGVETSGQSLLYHASGRLLFSGGITGSRGHAGGNTGRNAIASLLEGNVPDNAQTSVFGCSLFNRQCAGWKEVDH
jgi:hypothetical protein